MTDEEHLEVAERLILEYAKDIEYSSIREELSEEVGNYTTEDVQAIYNLIAKAELDVFWPN